MTNKEAYNKGYKDGQEALAFHLELCKEEQEPCADCISRERLLSGLKAYDHGVNAIPGYVWTVINEMPSIQPK